MTAAHLMVLLVMWGTQPEGKKLPPPSEAEIYDVRQMLRVDEFKQERTALIELGERVFPIYLRILAAKDADPTEVGCIFGVLAAVKADRSQFLEHAVAGLTHEHVSVRRVAVQLLAQIGTVADLAPVVAMLSDSEWTNAIAAGKTLAAIGDKRTLTAMDVWLNSHAGKADSDKIQVEVHKHVTKARDELKARLDKAKPPGK